ncbi:pentalenene oxygenase [Amycolatopsis xylanica]|uniref:Pentalenene oxygenase n=1 Tax=Amycolatopsis xylanica TaxID=589385 RepID=A0A1H3NMM6_9PSEU|nr:cytochrome P450 [Amycolatopsis xylanica]SDY90207.1 pentalenene oxygenase [Amycolatopsis xylanica]
MTTTAVAPPTVPGALPLVGHTVKLLRRPLALIAAADPQDDLAVLRVGPRHWYLVSGPELVRQVLVTDAAKFDRGAQFEQVARLLGRTSLTTSGEQHRLRRRLVRPALDRVRTAEYGAAMTTAALDASVFWHDGRRLALEQEISAYAYTVVTRTLVRAGLDASVIAEFQRLLPQALDGVTRAMYDPFGVLRTPQIRRTRRTRRALGKVRATLGQAIAHHRNAGHLDQGDVLSMLLSRCTDDLGPVLTDREICDEIMGLLLAGTETVTSALCWAFHILATRPEIEQRVQAEADRALQGWPARVEDLARLPYTQRVITEVLRMYPPPWMLARRTVAEVDLGGRRLPAHTPVFVCLYLLHRRRESFPAPERFDPDRWLPDARKSLPPGAFLPFGAGPHQCPGDHFAVTMATLLLATLVQHWTLRPASARPVVPTVTPTLRPDQLDMIVTRRRRDY